MGGNYQVAKHGLFLHKPKSFLLKQEETIALMFGLFLL